MPDGDAQLGLPCLHRDPKFHSSHFLIFFFFLISEGDAWDTRFGETGHCVGCSFVGLRSLGAA